MSDISKFKVGNDTYNIKDEESRNTMAETVLSTDNVPFVSKTMNAGKYQRKKFVGCSFVWNQLVENGDFADDSVWSKYNVTLTANNNVGTITIDSPANTNRIEQSVNLKANHVYYYNFIVTPSKETTIWFTTESSDYFVVSTISAQRYVRTGLIKTSTDSSKLRLYINRGTNLQAGDTVNLENIFIIDLTQLFGSTAIADYIYNLEQATAGAGVAKLKELGFFTEDYYAYDPGSIQSVDIKEYKVTKDNIVTTYSLTPTELRGVPKIDANNNIYCDGDEYKSDGGHTSNYNIVDLGTKNWSYESARSIFYAVISDRFGNGVNGNGICSKYPFYGTDTDSALGSMSDKMFGFTSNSAQRYIYIKDSAYTDPTEFTASLSGVYLVYKKATPTTETLTPFDYPQSVGSLEEITDYKVEQEDRDVAIPTGHVTEYMGKGGEFTLPTLPETLSVLAFDGHNAYWEENTINLVKAFMNENRRTRRDITNDLANLSQAVAEQNLRKYGYSIGDYFTGASGYTYTLADPNPFKGTYTPYCINANHLGIVVDTHAQSQWHSENAASVGYNDSVLHDFLKTTVLDTIKTDFIALFGGTTGLEHLKAHSKLLTTALANSGWTINQYISALTCTQIDAGSQWSANGYQEGESSKSLELFRKYKWTEIFGSEYPWLRNISNYDDSSASYACYLNHAGDLRGDGDVTHSYYAVGLIVFA